MRHIRRLKITVITMILCVALVCAALVSVSFAAWTSGSVAVSTQGSIGKFYVEYPRYSQATADTLNKNTYYFGVERSAAETEFYEAKENVGNAEEVVINALRLSDGDIVSLYRNGEAAFGTINSATPVSVELSDGKLTVNSDGVFDLYYNYNSDSIYIENTRNSQSEATTAVVTAPDAVVRDVEMRGVAEDSAGETVYTYHNYVCVSRENASASQADNSIAFVAFTVEGMGDTDLSSVPVKSIKITRGQTYDDGELTGDLVNPPPRLYVDGGSDDNTTSVVNYLADINHEVVKTTEQQQSDSHFVAEYYVGGAYCILYFADGPNQYFALDIEIVTTKAASFRLTANACNVNRWQRYESGYGEPWGFYLGGLINNVWLWDPSRTTKLEGTTVNGIDDPILKSVDIDDGNIRVDNFKYPSELDLRLTVNLTENSIVKAYMLNDTGVRTDGNVAYILPKKITAYPSYLYDGKTKYYDGNDGLLNENDLPEPASNLNIRIPYSGTYTFHYHGAVEYKKSASYINIATGEYADDGNVNGDDWYPVQNFNFLVDSLDIYDASRLKQELTVTFDANGGIFADGTDKKSVDGIPFGNKIAEPDYDIMPADDSQEFMGWFKDMQCTEAWNFSVDAVMTDITLYARWRERSTSASGYYAVCELSEGRTIPSLRLNEHNDIVGVYTLDTAALGIGDNYRIAYRAVTGGVTEYCTEELIYSGVIAFDAFTGNAVLPNIARRFVVDFNGVVDTTDLNLAVHYRIDSLSAPDADTAIPLIEAQYGGAEYIGMFYADMTDYVRIASVTVKATARETNGRNIRHNSFDINTVSVRRECAFQAASYRITAMDTVGEGDEANWTGNVETYSDGAFGPEIPFGIHMATMSDGYVILYNNDSSFTHGFKFFPMQLQNGSDWNAIAELDTRVGSECEDLIGKYFMIYHNGNAMSAELDEGIIRVRYDEGSHLYRIINHEKARGKFVIKISKDNYNGVQFVDNVNITFIAGVAINERPIKEGSLGAEGYYIFGQFSGWEVYHSNKLRETGVRGVLSTTLDSVITEADSADPEFSGKFGMYKVVHIDANGKFTYYGVDENNKVVIERDLTDTCKVKIVSETFCFDSASVANGALAENVFRSAGYNNTVYRIVFDNSANLSLGDGYPKLYYWDSDKNVAVWKPTDDGVKTGSWEDSKQMTRVALDGYANCYFYDVRSDAKYNGEYLDIDGIIVRYNAGDSDVSSELTPYFDTVGVKGNKTFIISYEANKWSGEMYNGVNWQYPMTDEEIIGLLQERYDDYTLDDGTGEKDPEKDIDDGTDEKDPDRDIDGEPSEDDPEAVVDKERWDDPEIQSVMLGKGDKWALSYQITSTNATDDYGWYFGAYVGADRQLVGVEMSVNWNATINLYGHVYTENANERVALTPEQTAMLNGASVDNPVTVMFIRNGYYVKVYASDRTRSMYLATVSIERYVTHVKPDDVEEDSMDNFTPNNDFGIGWRNRVFIGGEEWDDGFGNPTVRDVKILDPALVENIDEEISMACAEYKFTLSATDCSVENGTYFIGDSIKLIADAPQAGYEFDYFEVDGEAIDGDTFIAVKEIHRVRAVYRSVNHIVVDAYSDYTTIDENSDTVALPNAHVENNGEFADGYTISVAVEDEYKLPYTVENGNIILRHDGSVRLKITYTAEGVSNRMPDVLTEVIYMTVQRGGDEAVVFSPSITSIGLLNDYGNGKVEFDSRIRHGNDEGSIMFTPNGNECCFLLEDFDFRGYEEIRFYVYAETVNSGMFAGLNWCGDTPLVAGEWTEVRIDTRTMNIYLVDRNGNVYVPPAGGSELYGKLMIRIANGMNTPVWISSVRAYKTYTA